MEKIIQIATAAIGTLGYSLVFNVGKRHLLLSAIGGGLCWAAFLLLQELGMGVFGSTFFAAALMGLCGILASHAFKMPTTVFIVPACVPLIPGSSLYYALAALLTKNWAEWQTHSTLLVTYAMGIATGLAMVMELDYMRRRFRDGRRKQKA